MLNPTKQPLLELVVSIELGKLGEVTSALDSGIDVNAKYGAQKKPILHYASKLQNPEITQAMIGRKVNVDAVDDIGSTALHISSMRGNTKTIELLLDNDAQINLADKNGVTALHHALINRKDDVATLLINRDADVNVVMHEDEYLDYYQMSPLHIAADKGNIPMMKLLIRKGADLDKVTRDGETAEDIFNDKHGTESLLFQDIVDQALQERDIAITESRISDDSKGKEESLSSAEKLPTAALSSLLKTVTPSLTEVEPKVNLSTSSSPKSYSVISPKPIIGGQSQATMKIERFKGKNTTINNTTIIL